MPVSSRRSGAAHRRARHHARRSPTELVRRIDDGTVRWMSEISHGPARPLLRGLARAADLLLPFVAVTLRLVRTDPAHGRTLKRAWGAVLASGLVEGALVKPLIGRGRPDRRRLPPDQRRRSSPSSSSFASGHAGAGAAFATTVGRDVPSVRMPLALLAAVVAYAQLYTGRHYLSDVAVGSAIGVFVGALIDRSVSS